MLEPGLEHTPLPTDSVRAHIHHSLSAHLWGQQGPLGWPLALSMLSTGQWGCSQGSERRH